MSPNSRFFADNGLSLPASLAGLAASELGETETSHAGLLSAVVEVTWRQGVTLICGTIAAWELTLVHCLLP